MINTLRLTHHILFYVVPRYMFRSSLTIIRPVCESCFTNAGYTLGSHYIYNYASVYTCYINTLKSGHDFGPMEDIMDVIHFANKGRLLDTLERFHIYRDTQLGSQINDKLTTQTNQIFEAIIQNTPHGGQ